MKISRTLRSRLAMRRVEALASLRASIRRNSWWPPLVGLSLTLACGLWLGLSGSETIARYGQIATVVGAFGLALLWVQSTASRQHQRREMLAQMNSGASLDSCDFGGIDLAGAYLRGRSMNSVRLAQAKCRRVDFTGSEMHDAVLTRADLRDAQFNNVVGTELRAYRADMRGARFDGADLSGAHFESADLREADFGAAVLFGADFRCADLRGTDLSKADITGILLTGARCDDATLWPAAISASQLDARGLVLPYRVAVPESRGRFGTDADGVAGADGSASGIEPFVGSAKTLL